MIIRVTSTLTPCFSTVQLKCDGTLWRTGGEVKGKLANAMGSQYSSHYLGTWCIQHYYRWCAHLGCQQSTELTPPGRFKWTRPFRRKTKSDFCACVITFQLASNNLLLHTIVAVYRQRALVRWAGYVACGVKEGCYWQNVCVLGKDKIEVDNEGTRYEDVD